MEMKQRKNLLRIIFIIGVMLILLVINDIYRSIRMTNGYEETEAICDWQDKIVKHDENGQYIYYQRRYCYTVDGKEYTLSSSEVNKKPYKIIKYNPNNPNEAKTYELLNLGTIVISLIGLICVFSPFISSMMEKNKEKTNDLKYKIFRFSKRNMIKMITICFCLYVVLSLNYAVEEVFLEIGLTPSEFFSEVDFSQITISDFQIIAKSILFIFVCVIFETLPVILLYLGVKFGIQKYKKDKLSDIDFKKYKNYYREILNGYSPAELSYVDNFEISYENDIVATLLSLEIKKKIVLDDSINQITIKNNSAENLSSNEKYILDSIENGKVCNLNEDVFMTKVKEDAEKNELLKASKIDKKHIIKILSISIFAIALLSFVSILLFNNWFVFSTHIEDWKILTFVCGILLIIYIPIFVVAYFYTYIRKVRKNNDIRTQKGEIINENLEGLKNYLKDYSIIHEKNEKNLILWEEYLIYSVIFNQNTKIIQSVWDKYISI